MTILSAHKMARGAVVVAVAATLAAGWAAVGSPVAADGREASPLTVASDGPPSSGPKPGTASGVSSTASPVVASPAASPLPIDISQLTGRIAFTRAGGSFLDETIYVADATGSHETRISEPGQGCCPRWAPGGSALLFGALDPDGVRWTTGYYGADGSLLRIVPLPSDPINLGADAVSRDGTRLLCEGWSDDGSRNGTYVRNATDGGSVVRIADQQLRGLDFSADGADAFVFEGVDAFPTIGDQPEGSIWEIALDGSDAHRVTPPDMPVEVTGNSGGRLSPDGQWLVFASAGALWRIHPDGTGLVQIYADGDGKLAITPTWSPDGTMILFGLDPPDSLATVDIAPPNTLSVVRVDGTGLTDLVQTSDWKRNPEWTATTAPAASGSLRP